MNMRVGLVQCVGEPSAFLSPVARNRHQVHIGDYVLIECARHDTSIVRQVRLVDTRSSVRDDYVYLDALSLHLLSADIEETVKVSRSALNLDVP
jgi:hypothetical protein